VPPLETIVVMKETYVAAGDTVQTQGDGKAVQMIDGSKFCPANNTVVIRDTSSLLRRQNVRVAQRTTDSSTFAPTSSRKTPRTSSDVGFETRLKEQTMRALCGRKRNSGEIRISRGSVETTVGGETPDDQ
jgi:hypothetical protein